MCIAVFAAPCNIMHRNLMSEIRIIDIQIEIFSHDSAGLASVCIWDTKSSAFIVHKSIKADLSDRTQVFHDFFSHCQYFSHMHTFITVYFCRNAIHSTMISAILFVTPDQCITVQICNISKCSSSNKIFFYKADKSFHLSLCKGVSAFTQLCMEADCFHEGLIILLP